MLFIEDSPNSLGHPCPAFTLQQELNRTLMRINARSGGRLHSRGANLPYKSETDVASQNVIAPERDARHDGGRSAGLARKCPAAHDSADNRCEWAGGCHRR